MHHTHTAFAHLGISTAAERLYRALLLHGSLSIAALAQRTGLYRPAVYRALPELLAARLASPARKGRRTIYRAESPVALNALAKHQEAALRHALPDLLAAFQRQGRGPTVTFLEGKDGIMTAYERLIAATGKGGVLYRYESPRDYAKNKRYYPSAYWKRAGATGDIDKLVITNEPTHRTRHNNLNRSSKAVQIPFTHNITHIVGKGIVAFIDYDKETAVLIDDDRFADFQRSIFMVLFARL